MRLLISIMAVVLLALILFAACNSNELTPAKTSNPFKGSNTPAPEPPPGDNARRITPAELKIALASNTAVIIDVRAESAYKEGHIKGARLIPFNEILARVDELPRDKMIATYCS
jgi:3-mercaptopyruvate sulfurtransferase SseA